MPRVDLLTDTLANTPADTHRTEFADNIPIADTAGLWKRKGRRPAKRNRQWEKLHRPYRYVNVPLELREQVVALAEHLEVTADEVARAMIEYGIDCVDEDSLRPETRPNPRGRKLTLFPREQAKGWQEMKSSPKEIPARRKKKSDQIKKTYPAVCYRLPESLHNNLCGLAMELAVPIGEVLTFLLRHGL